MRHNRVLACSFLIMHLLLPSCTPGVISDGGPTPTPLDLKVPELPTPVTTPEAFLPLPTPVPTAEPSATPYPEVIPRYASRCTVPSPRPYPMAYNYVGDTTPTPTIDVVIARDFANWCYQVVRVQGHLLSDVSYDRSTIAALETFGATNRDLAEELAQEGGRKYLFAFFRDPLEPGDFRAWVRENNVWAEGVLGDCSNCPTGGLGWRMASRDEPYYDDGPEGTHQVVVGVWGSVEAELLPRVASSPPVFIADVTSNILQRDLDATGLIDAAGLEKVPYLEMMPILPMRELGLQRFEYSRAP